MKRNKKKCYCGEYFEAVNPRKKYCSNSCKHKLHDSKRRPRKTPIRDTSKCKLCDEDAYTYKGGKSSYCKSHTTQYNKAITYGITMEDVEELMSRMKCESCGDSGKPLVIDHCHETGRVRGVLCNQCNTSLGLLKEDVGRMANLIKYTNEKC